MRQSWDENRDAVMESAPPFMRPWGWWKHDAPEPRRRWPMLFAFGPEGWAYYPPDTTGLNGAKDAEVIEDERAYLVRLDLLTDQERELLNVEVATNGKEEASGGPEAGAPLP